MEALLTMFAAECHLGRELTRTELIDGSLSTLLDPEDFDEAFNVSFTYLTVPTEQTKDDSSNFTVILTDIPRVMCCACGVFEILCLTDSSCQVHHSIVAHSHLPTFHDVSSLSDRSTSEGMCKVYGGGFKRSTSFSR